MRLFNDSPYLLPKSKIKARKIDDENFEIFIAGSIGVNSTTISSNNDLTVSFFEISSPGIRCIGTCSKSICSSTNCSYFFSTCSSTFFSQSRAAGHLQQNRILAAKIGHFSCKWSVSLQVFATSVVFLLQVYYFCCECPFLLQVTYCK